MATHTRGPRKRKSRSGASAAPRPGASGVSRSGTSEAARSGASEASRSSAPEAARSDVRGASASRSSFGYASAASAGRPRAPWHPLPLSELLILAGAIGLLIGLRRGFAGGRLMLAGMAAVALGTIEVTLREHRSGFRSHTLLLSLLPVVVLHTGTVLAVGAFTTVPRLLNAALLALDVALFAVLFKLLRRRFLDARARRRR